MEETKTIRRTYELKELASILGISGEIKNAELVRKNDEVYGVRITALMGEKDGDS